MSPELFVSIDSNNLVIDYWFLEVKKFGFFLLKNFFNYEKLITPSEF
jgi:hypothetical protein